MANSSPTIMPSYVQRPVDSGRWRRAATLLSRILLAAGYGILVVVLRPQQYIYLAIPIIVMLLVTLWMLPDRRTFPLTVLERIFPYYFVFSIVWPVYLAVQLPGLPWLTPTRMFLFVQTFFLAYSVSTSSTLRHHLVTVARGSGFFWGCFLVWELMQVITIPTSRQPAFSAQLFANQQMSLIGPFFLGCLLFSREGWARWVAGTLVVLAVVTSLDGFIELRLGYPPWANHIPSFLRVDEGIMANVLGSQSRTADGLYRVRGPFPISLVFSEYLALCMPFIIHWIFTGETLVRRLLMGVAFFVVLAAIVITQSRLGLVGTMVAAALYPLIWAYRTWRSRRGGMFGPIVLLGAPFAALMLIGVIFSSHTLTLKVMGGGAQSASDASRAAQREMAIPHIIHNPFGYGLGRATTVVGFTNPGGYLTLDSGILSVVLDLGVVGLFGFVGMFANVAYTGARVYLRSEDEELSLAGPAAIALVEFLIIRGILSQTNNWWIAMLLLSMILGLLARQRYANPIAVPAEPGSAPHPAIPSLIQPVA